MARKFLFALFWYSTCKIVLKSSYTF
jgi:hypothetical protein